MFSGLCPSDLYSVDRNRFTTVPLISFGQWPPVKNSAFQAKCSSLPQSRQSSTEDQAFVFKSKLNGLNHQIASRCLGCHFEIRIDRYEPPNIDRPRAACTLAVRRTLIAPFSTPEIHRPGYESQSPRQEPDPERFAFAPWSAEIPRPDPAGSDRT